MGNVREMSEQGCALSLTPEIMNKINSDCVKAYLDNNIPEDWAAAVTSIALSAFDAVAKNVNEHSHKEETTQILTNLCVQLENIERRKNDL